MIKIIARISSTPEASAQLREILINLVAPTRAESGCRSYELFQDEEAPHEFITVECWADDRAAEAHMATAHVTAAIGRAAPLFSRPPVIHRFTQLA